LDEYYLIAKILSAGKEGFVKVQLVPGLNIDLDTIQFLYLDFWEQKKKIELEEILNIKQSVFFKFKNFDDERDISVLVNRDVFIDSDDLEKNRSLFSEDKSLIGCRLYKGQDFLGTVSDFFNTPANPVIEISRENGKSILIPFVTDVFEKVDFPNKILILNSGFGIDDDED
jgi:16S rRNA processing protein RimM